MVGGASSFYDIYYKKEEDLLSTISWKPLAKKSDQIKRIRVDKENRLIYLTSKNNSNNRLCRTPMSNINFDTSEILVNEKRSQIITKFQNTKDGIYYTTQKNGIEQRMYRLENDEEVEVLLPREVSQISIQSQSVDQDFLRVSTWGSLSPGIHYLYDFDCKSFRIEPIIPVVKHPDFDNLEIPSHDGVMVPIKYYP